MKGAASRPGAREIEKRFEATRPPDASRALALDGISHKPGLPGCSRLRTIAVSLLRQPSPGSGPGPVRCFSHARHRGGVAHRVIRRSWERIFKAAAWPGSMARTSCVTHAPVLDLPPMN